MVRTSGSSPSEGGKLTRRLLVAGGAASGILLFLNQFRQGAVDVTNDTEAENTGADGSQSNEQSESNNVLPYSISLTGPESIVQGRVVLYTCTIENNSNTAEEMTLMISVDENLTIDELLSSPGIEINGNSLTWTGTLQPNEPFSLQCACEQRKLSQPGEHVRAVAGVAKSEGFAFGPRDLEPFVNEPNHEQAMEILQGSIRNVVSVSETTSIVSE